MFSFVLARLKIANEKEVKAQVKLRFKSANQNQMLAVRNLSVTVKKTGLTMKTLESLLAKYPYKPGDKVRQSNHNHVVALLIGVRLVYLARRYLDQMRRAGRRDTEFARCLESRPRERHLLPSRRLLLAPCRSLGA